MAVLMTPPYVTFLDSSGDPLAGGKVNCYEVGTTTPKDSYTDAGGLTTHANPVILDSAGRAQIWLSGAYRFIITDSADVTIKDIDNVTAFSTALTSGIGDITSDFTEAVVALGDSFILSDADDNNATKRDTVQGIINLNTGGLVLLESQTASTDASINFTTGIDSTYECYVLMVTDLVPATDGANVYIRLGNGGAFDSGVNNYTWAQVAMGDNGTTVAGERSAGDTEIQISSAGVGSAAGEAFNCTIKIYNPAGTNNTIIEYATASLDSSTIGRLTSGAGQRVEAAAHDRIQVIMSAGSIASGSLRLYGVQKS